MKTLSNTFSKKKNKGFLLLESLLGFSIFAIAATGIIVAMHQTALLSQSIAEEQRLTQQGLNLLKEILHTPTQGNDFAKEELISIDSFTQAHIVISPYEIADQDGNNLEQLYQVSVTLTSSIDGVSTKETFSTIHRLPLFSNT